MYEPADHDACMLELADRAVPGGELPDAGALVAAAAGCDAVHPGYGYLAENAEFAAAVHGPAWPGSGAGGGDARRRRQERGAPAGRAPGCRSCPARGVALDDDTLRPRASGWGCRCWSRRPPAAAAAACARGRRGRPARAVAAARREAAAAFGDDRVFLERRLAGARHVEVQMLGDAHGARRPPGRARLLAAAPPPEDDRGGALAGGRTPSYARRWATPRSRSPPRPATSAPARSSSCSTEDGGWYFLEVNARLQVEHPVTEAVIRHRPGARAARDGGGRAARARAGRGRRARPRHRGPALCRGSGGRVRARAWARCSGSRCRSGPAFAAIGASAAGGPGRRSLRPDAGQADRPRRGSRRVRRADVGGACLAAVAPGVHHQPGVLALGRSTTSVPRRRGAH